MTKSREAYEAHQAGHQQRSFSATRRPRPQSAATGNGDNTEGGHQAHHTTGRGGDRARGLTHRSASVTRSEAQWRAAADGSNGFIRAGQGGPTSTHGAGTPAKFVPSPRCSGVVQPGPPATTTGTTPAGFVSFAPRRPGVSGAAMRPSSAGARVRGKPGTASHAAEAVHWKSSVRNAVRKFQIPRRASSSVFTEANKMTAAPSAATIPAEQTWHERQDSATGHRRQNVSPTPVGRQSPVNAAMGRPSQKSPLVSGGVAMSKKDGNGSSSGPSSAGHHGTGSASSPSCAAASGVGRPAPRVSGGTTHQQSRGPSVVPAEKVGDTADRRPDRPSDGDGERVCVESVMKRRSSRIRPRSAVARVEGSPQHTTEHKQAGKPDVTSLMRMTMRAPMAATSPVHARPNGIVGSEANRVTIGPEVASGRVGRPRVASSRPQSATIRTENGLGGMSQSVLHRDIGRQGTADMSKQRRAGDATISSSLFGKRRPAAGGGKPPAVWCTRRPYLARIGASTHTPTRVSTSTNPGRTALEVQALGESHIWERGAAVNGVNVVADTPVSAPGAAAKTADSHGGKQREGADGSNAGCRSEVTEGKRNTYCRLLGLKHSGSYRRAGADQSVERLSHASKDTHRASGTPGAGVAPGSGKEVDIAGASSGAGPKTGLPTDEMDPALETQATVSTANTGSLTPLGEGSSPDGRTVVDGTSGDRNTSSPLEALTVASEEFCNPQERQYLWRLMLDLQGNSRSSLEFYRLGKVLGEGSFAKVRVAWHKLTGQRVAVKTYEKAKIKDKQQWKRILQEVELMEKLNHPRVIRLFETAESSKRIHLVMEYADGGNLCSYVKRKKRLDEGEARRILLQLLEGVEYMHGLDIVHRDIKLENILLEGGQRVNAKLVDFGFSADIRKRPLHIFCGTPSYMAPEIIKRQPYEGKPVDIWCLGVVLYAMLCGRFPFLAPNHPDLYKSISKGVFRLPDSLSSSANSLIRGILVTDPTKRLTLRQIMVHPWLMQSRVMYHSVGSHYRPARVEAGNGSSPLAIKGRESQQREEGARGTGCVAAFHISSDPRRDLCAQSVKRMEAFGVDGGEITRQVLGRRHSCLTTTFYLLKNELAESTRRKAHHAVAGGTRLAGNSGTPVTEHPPSRDESTPPQ